MANRYRLILASLLLTALVGCSGSNFNSFGLEVEPIEDTTVVRTARYQQMGNLGPTYQVSLEVPEAWVGTVATRSNGSTIIFEEINPDNPARSTPLFYVEALSEPQYWEQVGSYPGQFTNLGNTWDTYFVWYLPNDMLYLQLTEDEKDERAALVRGIVPSFSYQAIEDSAIFGS